MINGQWIMIRGSGLWRGVDPWPRAPGCPGVSIRFEGSLHAMHAVQGQKAVHFGTRTPCKVQNEGHFGIRTPCKVQNEGHFGLCTPCKVQNEGHFGLCMPCKSKMRVISGLARRARGKTWQVS